MARTLIGQVVSDKADKTIILRVDRRVSHPVYKKQYNVTKKFVAHDEKNEAQVGDTVEVSEIAPMSKTKTWKLEKVIEKAKALGGDA